LYSRILATPLQWGSGEKGETIWKSPKLSKKKKRNTGDGFTVKRRRGRKARGGGCRVRLVLRQLRKSVKLMRGKEHQQ